MFPPSRHLLSNFTAKLTYQNNVGCQIFTQIPLAGNLSMAKQIRLTKSPDCLDPKTIYISPKSYPQKHFTFQNCKSFFRGWIFSLKKSSPGKKIPL